MKAPKIPSFFKSQQVRQFRFTPRYYDEQKERIEERRQALKKELAMEQKLGVSHDQFKQDIARNWKLEHRKKANISGSVRLLVIIVGLVYLFYQFYLILEAKSA